MLNDIVPVISSTWFVRLASFALCGAAILAYRRRPQRMKIVTVIDGDTLVAADPSGTDRIKLRLKGVDCPELGQRKSFEAKEFVESLVKGEWVLVRLYGKDKYRRRIARVQVGKVDVSKELIRHGFAFPLSGSGLGMLSLPARILGKGVWSGFGQRKPWETGARSSGILSFLNGSTRWRKFNRKRLANKHERRK